MPPPPPPLLLAACGVDEDAVAAVAWAELLARNIPGLLQLSRADADRCCSSKHFLVRNLGESKAETDRCIGLTWPLTTRVTADGLLPPADME